MKLLIFLHYFFIYSRNIENYLIILKTKKLFSFDHNCFMIYYFYRQIKIITNYIFHIIVSLIKIKINKKPEYDYFHYLRRFHKGQALMGHFVSISFISFNRMNHGTRTLVFAQVQKKIRGGAAGATAPQPPVSQHLYIALGHVAIHHVHAHGENRVKIDYCNIGV